MVQKLVLITMVPLWGVLGKTGWAGLSAVPLLLVLACLAGGAKQR